MKSLIKSVLVLAVLALISCEKQEYLKSESEIKKELGFTWKQVMMSGDTTRYPVYEIWNFKDDKLTFKRARVTDNMLVDSLSGSFSVNTTLTKVFLNTSGFPDNSAWHQMNAEWTVVALDSKILVIASEDSQAGGVFEREFVRVD
jgi:hypothetical protein